MHAGTLFQTSKLRHAVLPISISFARVVYLLYRDGTDHIILTVDMTIDIRPVACVRAQTLFFISLLFKSDRSDALRWA